MTDDDFYAQVAQEISEGRIDRTIWTKAFALQEVLKVCSAKRLHSFV